MNREPYFNSWHESWVSFLLGYVAGVCLGGCLVFALMPRAHAAEKRLPGEPTITVISLYNGPGIPEGWLDASTRPDATEICNQLIKNQSKEYANAISRSRCIIQVQK